MIEIEIIKSDRKTVSMEIKPDLRVIVRAPKIMKDADIQKFISEKALWLEKNLELMRSRRASEAEKEPAEPFTQEQILALAQQAKKMIPVKVKELARVMDITYGRITVRNQVSRWGSCSSKGNLNFNCLLMLCPDEVVEYVIVHELCHRKHMNHSAEFWKTVEKYCPDYKKQRNWLKENGAVLIERLRSLI